MNSWRRLTKDNLDSCIAKQEPGIFIARRSDGKACIGHVTDYNDRTVTVKNGNYEVTLWFTEPRLFTFVDLPQTPGAYIADRELPLPKGGDSK